MENNDLLCPFCGSTNTEELPDTADAAMAFCCDCKQEFEQ